MRLSLSLAIAFLREGQVSVEDGKAELLQLHVAEGAVAEVDGRGVKLDGRRILTHCLDELALFSMIALLYFKLYQAHKTPGPYFYVACEVYDTHIHNRYR